MRGPDFRMNSELCFETANCQSSFNWSLKSTGEDNEMDEDTKKKQ